MTHSNKAEQDAQLANLRRLLKPGDTVYTVLRHVSRSRGYREISVLLLKPDRKAPGGVRVIEPDYSVATVLGYKMAKNSAGIAVSGGGMDMGFHVVYTLGKALWPDGTGKPHGTRNGEPDRDGGYALKQRWL